MLLGILQVSVHTVYDRPESNSYALHYSTQNMISCYEYYPSMKQVCGNECNSCTHVVFQVERS